MFSTLLAAPKELPANIDPLHSSESDVPKFKIEAPDADADPGGLGVAYRCHDEKRLGWKPNEANMSVGSHARWTVKLLGKNCDHKFR